MLYDVIGVLQDVLKMQMGGGGRKSCVNIALRDIEGNMIEVALRGDYCKQFMNYNTHGKMVGPTVIVLTHAWCKINTVSGAPSLSNAWNDSRLLLNLDHPQIDEFKASLNEVKSISAIYELRKDCFTTTIGRTKTFKASKFGWYFESCPGCKQSNKSQGENFECPCGITNVEPITKFKIELELEYDNHKGTFVFWDKDVIPYTKLNAKELRQIMKEAGEEDNPKIWPVHLVVLLNKELVFRIKYQSSYEQFSIVAILNEENLFNKFDNYLCPNEVSLDANHAGSPTASSSSTPAKRVATSTTVSDLMLAEELTTKQSATKAKPGRKTKHIKKE
ncbi:uncharacterized protein LOC131622800 isoform X2 [Vicia villosa]|uniref:uncharacterized protein LOC131622800 isoform X2 n=1 Tax=Vicia villosa TaxID=3911 RepID=UPI00273B26E6|nr:uncharacterized protein LOC131622800 isoform X2 [Vicia villosa]